MTSTPAVCSCIILPYPHRPHPLQAHQSTYRIYTIYPTHPIYPTSIARPFLLSPLRNAFPSLSPEVSIAPVEPVTPAVPLGSSVLLPGSVPDFDTFWYGVTHRLRQRDYLRDELQRVVVRNEVTLAIERHERRDFGRILETARRMKEVRSDRGISIGEAAMAA